MTSFTSLLEEDDISSPINETSELTNLLLRTSAALDHNDEALHAEEVDSDVPILLFQALHEATKESYESDDVLLSLDSLIKILRCADDGAQKIFLGGCGVPLLQLLFFLAEMNYRLGNARIVSLCKSIIDRFASLEIDLTSMYQSYELLTFLVIAIEGTSGHEVVHCVSLVFEHLSRHHVNKAILVERRDVVDCLFGVVDGNHPNKTRILAMKTIANLVSENAVVYANNQLYVSILLGALLDMECNVREAAVESLLLLSTAPMEIRAALLYNSEEDLLDRFLIVTEDFTGSDHTRICALHAFTSLVKCTNTPNIAEDKVLRLKNLASGNKDLIATQAAIAIKVVSAVLGFSDNPSLLVALDAAVEMSSSSCLQVVMWTARLIREQSLDPLNHGLFIGTEGLLPAIVSLSHNPHPSVNRPAMETLNALASHNVGAVAIAKDEGLLSALVESVSGSIALPSDSIAQQIALQTLISLVTKNDSLELIVKQRDTFVDILIELSIFGCGKTGERALRAEAMEAVALLAQHL